jgi:hypothetical protein
VSVSLEVWFSLSACFIMNTTRHLICTLFQSISQTTNELVKMSKWQMWSKQPRNPRRPGQLVAVLQTSCILLTGLDREISRTERTLCLAYPLGC